MRFIYYNRLLLKVSSVAVMIYILIGFSYKPVTAANIAAFGDSITEGIGSTTGGYPPKLAGSLNLITNSNHVVDNHGKGGEATAWGNGRIHSVLENKSYQYILILEGTNDIYFGLSLESTQYYLEEMINKARNLYGVTPLIATLTPDARPTSPANIKFIDTTYNPLIIEIASNLQVPLVDLYNAVVRDWGVLSDDQLHPNDAGYWVVADTWLPPLKSLIEEEEERTDREEDEIDGEDDEIDEEDDKNEDSGGSSGGCFIDTVLIDLDNVIR